MTQSAQLIALMKSLGWEDISHSVNACHAGLHGYPRIDGGLCHEPEALPDLSLDLMASAEATLTDEPASSNPAKHQTWMYAYHLCRILGIDTGAAGAGHIVYPHGAFALIRATKEQRLEAYLKVKGLWRDQS